MIVALDERPDVVAIVPTLGGNIPRLRDCLASICASTFEGRLAIVVVWNDPRQPLVELGLVTVLQPGLNLGYVGGIRYAQRSVTAAQLWIIQDDRTVDPECLSSLVTRLNQPDTPGVVSPVFVDANGCIPAGSRGGVISSEGLMESRFPFADTLPSALDLSVRLDWLQLGGAVIRSDAWDAVGGMDASFFPVQWADVDFCFRVTQAGLGIALEPTARFTHKQSGSTPNLFLHFLGARNGERFRRKYFETLEQPYQPSGESDIEIVAREASLLTIDYAQHVEEVRQGLLEQIALLEAGRVQQLHVSNETLVAAHQLFQAEREAYQHEIDSLRLEVASLNTGLEQVFNSRSMRLTKPLRSFNNVVRKLRQR